MNKTKEKIGMQVIKRDGSCVDYDRSKIATAIRKANAEVEDSEKYRKKRSAQSLIASKRRTVSGCWWRISRTSSNKS